jgi:hypothetical protein
LAVCTGRIADREAFTAYAIFVVGAAWAAKRLAQIVFTRHAVRAEVDALPEIADAAIATRVFARHAAKAIDALIFRTYRLTLAQNLIAGVAGIARGIAVSQADVLPAVVDALFPRAQGTACSALAEAARTASGRAGLRLALALLAALARPALLLALFGRRLVLARSQEGADAGDQTDYGSPGAQSLDEAVESLGVHHLSFL